MAVTLASSAFFVSLAVAALIVLTRPLHVRWSGDFANSGVQKHHNGSPPRIGGVAVTMGFLAALLLLQTGEASAEPYEFVRTHTLLLLCSLPVVFFGLLEDLTKRVPVSWRLFGPVAGAVLAILLLGNVIPRIGIAPLDPIFGWLPMGIALTCLMVSGFTNAMNIVDGHNGLAGGLAVLMLAATGFIAYRLGDTLVVELCLMLGLAIAGFFVLNFPRGLIFLGDGGAYFIGFMLVQIWILLLVRHEASVSPWTVVAIGFYPTMETIFSIVRRKLQPGCKATAPDTWHLHCLIYRDVAKPAARRIGLDRPWIASSIAALCVLEFAALPIAAASVAPQSTEWGMTVIAVSAAIYLRWFHRLRRIELRRRAARTSWHGLERRAA